MLTKSTKIGIIGFGNVGSSVAANLLRNSYTKVSAFDVIKDISKSAPQIHVESSVESIAQNSDILITALPTPENVREVIEDHNVFDHLGEGKIWVDHSTTDYEQTIRFEKIAREKHGIHVMEAPVTGGMSLLKQGRMTMYVGGDESIYQQCLPLFSCSSTRVMYLGAIGSATITKVVSNMLAATNTVAMGEAMMIAKRSGVDLNTFFHAIRFSAGNSFVWETEGPLVLNGTYDPDFTVGLQCKDLQLGHEISRKYEIPLPIHGAVQHVYNRAQYKYGYNKGSSCPPKLLEDDLNEPLRADGFDDWSYTIDTSTNSVAVVHSTKDAIFNVDE